VRDGHRSVRGDQPEQPTLRSLNASRDLWERRFACPIIFWLPDYAVTLLTRHSPDLWRYVNYHFEFVSEQATAVAGMQERLAGDTSVAGNLPEEQKRFRIAELEQRLTDADELLKESDDQRSATLVGHYIVWLNELGFLHHSLGDLQQTEAVLRKGLALEEMLGRQEGMAIQYGNLGLVYRTRGELDRAEEMARESLTINEKLGRQEGLASQYASLGGLYTQRGELDRAEEMYRNALAIDEKLDSQDGMATSYANLGLVAISRGDLSKARELWPKARNLYDKIGIKPEVERIEASLNRLEALEGEDSA